MNKPSQIGTVHAEDGESGVDFWMFPTDDLPIEWGGPEPIDTMEKAQKMIDRELPGKSCNCIHDCCAHRFYPGPGKVIGFYCNRYFIVAHSWGINI